MSTRPFRWLLILGVLWVGVSVIGCQTIHEEDLFHPRRVARPPAQDGRDDVVLQVEDGLQIGGWNVRVDEPRAQLIYFYGNGETVTDSLRRMMWLAELWHVDVMCVDYRGYGFSDGEPGIRFLLDDALRVYDVAVTGEDRRDLPIIVFGRSLGTVAAQHIAANRTVAGLVLEAPFTRIQDVLKAWNRNMPIPVRWIIRLRPEPSLAKREQPIDLIPDYVNPLLVLHGTEDTVIPIELGRTMVEAAGSTNKIWCEVSGKGHNDLSLSTPDVQIALQQFFESLALPPP